MAYSEIHVEGIGKVRLFRRRGLKNIRVTLAHDGTVRLSVPWYVPKAAGIKFLRARQDWIETHRRPPTPSLRLGQRLAGKYDLKIYRADSQRASSRASDSEFEVFLPRNIDKLKAARLMENHVDSFLKRQCEEQIVPLLRQLADDHGFSVSKVKIKKLRSRWGSCNHKKEITLNVQLVNLPKDLAEYILVHELAHTRHLNHGPAFWLEVEKILPDYARRRKSLKEFNPASIHQA